MNANEKAAERAENTLTAAYADPLDVVAVLELARADAAALKNWEWVTRLCASQDAVQALVKAARESLRTEVKRHGEFSHDFEKDVKRCERCQQIKKLRLAIMQVAP